MVISEHIIKADVKKPITFVFLSDLHDCKNGPLIRAIRRSHADAILIGGDFIHDDKLYERGFELLRLCANILPTFCAIGNHEMKYRGNIISRIRASGVVLLDNRAVSFMGVNIGGLTTGYAVGEKQSHFLPTPPPCLDFIEEFASADGFKLLLSHHPEYYPAYIKKHTIDLTLSGHAHGGQWRFFGRGLYAPGQGIFPRYTSGMYDGRLIVSRGLSQKCIVPRINNDTEIVLVKLFPHTEE